MSGLKTPSFFNPLCLLLSPRTGYNFRLLAVALMTSKSVGSLAVQVIYWLLNLWNYHLV
jgi:hypothetical protein